METQENVPQVKKRLISLDALRGFDMFWIIGGTQIFSSFAKATNNEFMKTYVLPQFEHVEWQGFRFEDLIMPLFLFITGAAMPYSFAKRLSLGDSRAKLYGHIIKRVLVLYLFGMLTWGGLLKFDLSQLYLYSNTLQSIALGYLISSIIILNLRLRGQIIATAGLLLLFWALLAWLPMPVGEDGMLAMAPAAGEKITYVSGVYKPDVNVAFYIDKLVLDPYRHPSPYTWVLSSITFGASVMFGVWAGQILRTQKTDKQKLLHLIYLGFGTIVLGLIWNIWFPIIKHIWTSSFVVYAAGFSYLCLAAFYFVVDMLNFKKWAFPFIVIGSNAIFVYVIVQFFDFRILADIFVKGLEKWTGDWHSFIRTTLAFVILWSLLYYMYKKKTFIKV